jgi:hypothetical protein
VHIGTDACDHSKQKLESEIPPETQNYPESEVTDGCDPSKKSLDKTEVCHKNFDIDSNDQTKQTVVDETPGTANLACASLSATRTRDWYRKPT